MSLKWLDQCIWCLGGEYGFEGFMHLACLNSWRCALECACEDA